MSLLWGRNMIGALVAMQQLLGKIEARLRPVLATYRLTPQDLPLMGLLAANCSRAMSGSLLADRLGRARQNLQVTLHRLERSGMVESRDDADGSVCGWTISNVGLERWKELQRDLARIEGRTFTSLDDAKNFVASLDLLSRRLAASTRPPIRELRDVVHRYVDLESELDPDPAEPASAIPRDDEEENALIAWGRAEGLLGGHR